MDNKLFAVLIDTASIQEYIFMSNKLKENVGASFLVERVFQDELNAALSKVFDGENINLNSWKENPERNPILNTAKFQVGYIGGGNALILFKDKDKDNIAKFIKEFTKLLLQYTPGLRTSFGVIDDFSFNEFASSMKKLNSSLGKNKNYYFPVVKIPKHGITADCPFSGESAEFKYEENKFISGVSFTKIGANEDSKERINKIFEDTLKGEFTFTNDIGELGQEENKNFIAVAHIDGNGMGIKVKSCDTLNKLRCLSKKMTETVKASLDFALSNLIDLIEKGKLKNAGIVLKKPKKKTILPIRPIVIGGDDITFVSEGRIGLYLVEQFFHKYSEFKFEDNQNFSASAGISIVKTKYPFYRAYKLAEELCNEAKKKARENPGSSYIDFFVSSGGASGEIEEIRKKRFITSFGNLHFGPYVFGEIDEENSIKNLKNGIRHFQNFPKTKLMQLRDTIFNSTEEECKAFVNELEKKGYSLYKIKNRKYHEQIWQDNNTPYYEIIEIIDFYPNELLEV